ncbi:hypothetical protein Tco_0195945 [Tanacetum coccineum]
MELCVRGSIVYDKDMMEKKEYGKLLKDSIENDKYVTMVRQVNNLHEIDYDQLYDYMKQNEKNVNASRAKRAAKTHDPLALVADFDYETQSFEIQGDTTNDDPTDNLTTKMMPLEKAITQHYSHQQTNRLRASSNTHNQVYVQDGHVMAISVISISSDSSEDSVGTPAGRVILFGTIPTTIPDTTPVITPPATQTDTPVIPTETPIIAPTIPPSPDVYFK